MLYWPHPPESLLQPWAITTEYMQIDTRMANNWKENNEMANNTRGKQKRSNPNRHKTIQRITIANNWEKWRGSQRKLGTSRTCRDWCTNALRRYNNKENIFSTLMSRGIHLYEWVCYANVHKFLQTHTETHRHTQMYLLNLYSYSAEKSEPVGLGPSSTRFHDFPPWKAERLRMEPEWMMSLYELPMIIYMY